MTWPMSHADLDAPHAVKALALLRKLCLALPGVEERMSWGHPNWFTKRGMFAAIGEYKGEVSIGLNFAPEEQALLIADSRFFVTPYVGKKGWTSLRVTGAIDAKLLKGLVLKAHSRVAAAGGAAPSKAPTRRPASRPRRKA
jgi:predicted DNA-binding protein (MmcQ/YjbR family)